MITNMPYITIIFVTILIGTTMSTLYYKDSYEKEVLKTVQMMQVSDILRATNERIQDESRRKIAALTENYKHRTDSLRSDIARLTSRSPGITCEIELNLVKEWAKGVQ